MEGDADLSVQEDLTIAEGHDIAERVEHALLHATPHLEAVTVHLHPLLDGVPPPDLHELSGHHAAAEAREEYRRRHGAAR